MAETTVDMRGLPRSAAYVELTEQVNLVLEGIDDQVSAMATISALLQSSLGFLWTGFYRVVEPGKLMRIGPYQGSLGCLEIEFGKGVCGTAATEKRTVVVDDVGLFPGHITCDARARSEIVVPVFNRRKDLIAVLDVDSEEQRFFGDEDRIGLEEIVKWFKRTL
ncbi:MAG: GAF domain-containing protein [Gemmatimonadaceae bacterium]